MPFATPEGDSIPVSVQDHGQQSEALEITVRAAAPRLAGSILNVDGTPNSFDSTAKWGSTVTIFVTGAGSYSPPLEDGEAAPTDASHQLRLPVSVGFLSTSPTPEPGTILYAGPVPGFVGISQINIQLPPGRTALTGTPVLTIGSASVRLPGIVVQ